MGLFILITTVVVTYREESAKDNSILFVELFATK